MANDGIKWITKAGKHIPIGAVSDYMNKFIRNKGKNNDYEKLKKMSDDVDFSDKSEEMVTNFYKKIGYDKEPISVTNEQYEKLRNKGYVELSKGVSGFGTKQQIDNGNLISYTNNGSHNKQYAFMTGVYSSYDDGAKNAFIYSRFDNNKTYTVLVDKNAKIISENKLNELRTKYNEIALQNSNTYHKMSNIINKDDGIFASTLGYDVIDYEDAKYMAILNKSKVILKK